MLITIVVFLTGFHVGGMFCFLIAHKVAVIKLGYPSAEPWQLAKAVLTWELAIARGVSE